MSDRGADLALLLLGGYRRLVDGVIDGLAADGFPDVRPTHEYALRAIDDGADTASALARRLDVTKQAAAKTIASLVERGWVAYAEAAPADPRRKPLAVTPRGRELMRRGAELFDELRASWAERVGADRLADLESQLRELVGDAPVRPESAGWVSGER